jgi:hypothetical protein
MRSGASLCRCATYSGRLSYAQILEAADSVGVTVFLCRILDTDFGEFDFPGTCVNKGKKKGRSTMLRPSRATAYLLATSYYRW